MTRQRLSLTEIRRAYGVSRSTLEGLIAQGVLIPERIAGRGKRYFKPGDVEALFTKQRQTEVKDLGDLMQRAYVRAFGRAPQRRS